MKIKTSKLSKPKHGKKRVTSLPRSVVRLFPNVTRAYDSQEVVEVTVEEKDCKEGKKKDPNDCAMARAIKRTYHADGAIIGMAYSYLISGNTATRFKTPESVSREIVSFDRNQDFAPGEYILTPPPPTSRLGYHNGGIGGHKPKRIVHKLHKTRGIRVLPKGASYYEER